MANVNYNRLGQMYLQLPKSKKESIKEHLEAAGETFPRLRYWFANPDERRMQMPTILKEIVCANIPGADDLFQLPPATT